MACDNTSFLSATAARATARDNKAIYREICRIQSAILEAISCCTGPCPYDIVINGGTPITSSYGINGVYITNSGSEYSTVVPIVDVVSSLGTGFVGTANVDQSTGEILSISILSAGIDYAVSDAVTIAHLSTTPGTGFMGYVSSLGANNGVGAISIVDGGIEYYTEPRIVVTDPLGTGTGFVGNIVESGGVISAATVVSPGTNYSSQTFASVIGNGVGATLSLKMDSQSFMPMLNSELYYQVWTGLVDNKPILDQLRYIQKYFTDLGYNFRIQVNPVTMNTLQYQISW